MLISCVYNSIMAPNGQIPKSQESKGKTNYISSFSLFLLNDDNET